MSRGRLVNRHLETTLPDNAPNWAEIAANTNSPHAWSCNPHDRVYLRVPFRDHLAVKALGARFSPELKRWFISPSHDTTPFSRWLPGHDPP